MLTCCATWVVLFDHPEPKLAQLICIVWGSQGKRCTVALLTRCLWFPSAAASHQRAATKKEKLHPSVLHIKTWLLLPLYSAGFLNTTDHVCVHLTTLSLLLTNMFFIKIIMELWLAPLYSVNCNFGNRDWAITFTFLHSWMQTSCVVTCLIQCKV